MSSEIETIKTNEFLQRRKLRILQVREQSKDIAKKIRQRTKLEKLRHVVQLDANKEREYLKQQEKLVEELEKQYASGLKNVGTSHKSASDLKDSVIDKVDLSKARAKAAAVQLRQQKQKDLDEKKQLLDRKLQAREVANELSREKSATVSNKVKFSKITDNKTNERNIDLVHTTDKPNESDKLISDNGENKLQNDMATQWDCDALPNAITPVSNENVERINIMDSNRQNKFTKKINLFALSDEMPSSLRGGSRDHSTENTIPLFKPSSVISEYLQNRGMRLRETEPTKSSADDLQNIKKTIIQSRLNRPEGNTNKICDVVDNEVVPVPSWHAEPEFQLCLDSIPRNALSNKEKDCHNKLNTSKKIHPNPVLRGSTPFRRTEICSRVCSGKRNKLDKSSNQITSSSSFNKANSVTMYNHSTRDARNMINHDEKLVVRDLQDDDDAYSQALKETSTCSSMVNNSQHKKLQDMRHKVAVSKQKVQKEYEDTIAFLKSLPKESDCRPIKKAYMPDNRIQQRKDNRQKKMQYEFRKIEKECLKKCNMCSSCNMRKHKKCTKSSVHIESNDDVSEKNTESIDVTTDNQYSWVPVPESDNSLAIHKIPNTKENKTHSVKFDDANTYHEYRSRHKHTPPTKDIQEHENKDNEATHNNSLQSETSSNESTQKESNNSKDLKEAACAISDSDRIIIYKILDSERSSDAEKQSRKQLTKNVVTSLTSIDKEIRKYFDDKNVHSKISVEKKMSSSSESQQKSFELLTEGIYKTVRKKGNNINTLYYSDEDQNDSNKNNEDICKELCNCGNSITRDMRKIAADIENDKEAMDCKIQEDNNAPIGFHLNNLVKCSNCIGSNQNDKGPESSLSNSSYKTATEKVVQANKAKLMDSSEKEPGNFYIGASGYLKDDDYEVIIQLRKKENCNLVKNKDMNQGNNYVHAEPLDIKVASSKDDANVIVSNGSQINEIITNNEAINSEELLPHENNCHGENEQLQGERASNAIKTSSGPGTSTYTQTSMYDSPVHRPVYLHMSSSTSTTYMSPPDKIYPKLLNRIYDISEKVVPYKDSNDMLNVNEENIPSNESFSQGNFKNKKNNKSKDRVKKKQRNHTCNRPNQHKQVSSKKSRISHSNSTKMTKIISDNEIRNKFQHKKNNETNLHPLIKNYVHKVLNLNKEGIKAVEVATQYCSSVSTPESSVINISSNIDKNICPNTKATITLEHIKNILQKEVANNSSKHFRKKYFDTTTSELEKNTNRRHRMYYPKSKYRHKVKSLNISKKLVTLFNNNNDKRHALSSNPSTSSSSHLELNNSDNNSMSQQNIQNKRSPRPPHAYQLRRMKTASDIQNTDVAQSIQQNSDVSAPYKHKMRDERNRKAKVKSNFNESLSKSCSNQNLKTVSSNDITKPANISTQTNENFVYDTKLNQLKENKIQNMEKIANLTEKCTKRLSDLAKVLHEVRKNKSTAYCKFSNTDTSSDADQNADRSSSHNECASNKYSHIHEYKISKKKRNSRNNEQFEANDLRKKENAAFVPIFENIPKPFELEESESNIPQEHVSVFTQVKARCKPPVALSRMNLKLGEENIVPHELSTVLEIESPISIKIQSPTIQTEGNELKTADAQSILLDRNKHEQTNSDNVKTDLTGEQNRIQYIKKSSLKKHESSKLHSMMDLSKFNDIMLKPFVTLEEYAKQCNVGTLDEGSNLEDFPKDDVLNDEISSLHSDGSLPDVISELLKRNMISEPFRFDSLSNANSTTISSGSSASMLMLSKNKKKVNIEKPISKKVVDIVPNDSSDSPSISSNPDLENTFKKLGMGWASSTLKKTKERLAWSSSTSTSTSNTSYKFQVKKRNVIPDIPIPALISDSLSKELSDIKISYDKKQTKSRSLEQKTLTKSMTVKDFLTNELANKITFTNNSAVEETEQHFTSLYSTKLPIASADGTEDLVANQSSDDLAQPGSQQRTSTPVQLFKSLNYNTNSSSYNNSNGLFSNIDDLSSVKVTSSSLKNSNTDKDDLSIPNYSLKLKRDKTDHSKSGD